MGEEIL